MEKIQIIALLALGWCIVFCFIHFFRLLKLGKVKDLSQKSGNVTQAVIYSNTEAMLPTQKESAYLHLPSFTAGIFFHIGTFISLLFFIVFFFVDVAIFWEYTALIILTALACVFVTIGELCGLILFLKREFSSKLKEISNADDFFSTFLTMLFQCFTVLYLVMGERVAVYYYIIASILLLYIPVGKLRHVVYYFAARYHLGFFYGWRNSWPPKKLEEILK